MTITRIDVVWIPITKILKEATITVPIMSKYLSKNIIGMVVDFLIPSFSFIIIDFMNSPDFPGLMAKLYPEK